MRAHSAAFLSGVEARPVSPEAGVAHRVAGIHQLEFAGEYPEAREHLERAFALFQPAGTTISRSASGRTLGVAAMVYLACVVALGDVDRAISLLDAIRNGSRITQSARSRTEEAFAASFELMRGDHARAASNAPNSLASRDQHDLTSGARSGVFLQGVTGLMAARRSEELQEMRRGVELLRRTECPAVRWTVQDCAG